MGQAVKSSSLARVMAFMMWCILSITKPTISKRLFSQNSISIRRLGVNMVFDYVDMEKSDHLYYQNALGFMTYMPNSYNNNLGNANNTIYYYDKSIDFYASGKTLFTKAEFSQTFTGQNSAIVFGAKSIWTSLSDAPQSNTIIRFGDNKGARE